MTIPSGFHPTLCHEHAEVKPCPKCEAEDSVREGAEKTPENFRDYWSMKCIM